MYCSQTAASFYYICSQRYVQRLQCMLQFILIAIVVGVMCELLYILYIGCVCFMFVYLAGAVFLRLLLCLQFIFAILFVIIVVCFATFFSLFILFCFQLALTNQPASHRVLGWKIFELLCFVYF